MGCGSLILLCDATARDRRNTIPQGSKKQRPSSSYWFPAYTERVFCSNELNAPQPPAPQAVGCAPSKLAGDFVEPYFGSRPRRRSLGPPPCRPPLLPNADHSCNIGFKLFISFYSCFAKTGSSCFWPWLLRSIRHITTKYKQHQGAVVRDDSDVEEQQPASMVHILRAVSLQKLCTHSARTEDDFSS